MKRGVLLFVVIAVLLALGVALAALVLHDGMSAAATPTKLEEFLARNARRLATPSKARAMVNPMPPTEANLRDARLHFADHCATCHGNDGSGQTLYGQNLSDGELFWIIEHGVRFTGMPSFAGHHGNGDDSWKLVLFIRHLPQLAPTEREEMERNNPKAPDDRKEEQQEDNFLDQAAPRQAPQAPAASKTQPSKTKDAPQK